MVGDVRTDGRQRVSGRDSGSDDQMIRAGFVRN